MFRLPGIKFLLIALVFFLFSGTVSAKTIQSTTMNIRWYGNFLEGKKDFRIPWLQEYLEPYFKSQDIIHFQEIKKIDSFLEDVVQNKMKCHGNKLYHLVICIRKSWNFLPFANDEDFTIEEAALGRSGHRGALHGVVANSNKKPLFHFIGVHLKAYPKESKIREEQIKQIAKYLKKNSSDSDLPVIMSGDFNSFRAIETEREKDDIEIFQSILSDVDLKRVDFTDGYSFVKPIKRSLIDHYWVSNSVEIEDITVPKLCTKGAFLDGYRFDNIRYYNYFISDHCPLKALFTIK